MRSRVSLLALLLALQAVAESGKNPVLLIGDEVGPWKDIFSSVGLTLGEASDLPPSALSARADAGSIVIVQGHSEFAAAFGIHPGAKRVTTRHITDARDPKLPVIWQRSLDLPEVSLPPDAVIFAQEHWTGMPVLAGLRRGKGAVLWLAAPPGVGGYERFPYLLHALVDLGLDVPVTSNRLWAFLDTSYRSRVDVEYIADRWKRIGLSALHLAAWHYNEPDAERDKWLRQLIDACHRRGLLVYAWIEFPHVSERFWQDHPEWREKTALLQDAHLDWRKLMNLRNRECAKAVEAATSSLMSRFDWDGINIGELYYESLEGTANPARFTPMNDEIRAEYKALSGTDPYDLFRPGARQEAMAEFLQYRAESARRMQSEWMAFAESLRASRPWLDIVLTHVDDRFDTRMRDLIGADAARVLPLLKQHDFTFLIEDPATVWHLGPGRYRQIAERYAPITPRTDRLAIDINIVERYQDVYPTKQQTGTELLSLVHIAAQSFQRVALYFENSISRPDFDLLPAAAAAVSRLERPDGSMIVDSPFGTGVKWSGPALVDGKPWPVVDASGTVWLPPGAHVLTAAPRATELRVERLNADLKSASVTGSTVQFAYQSTARATAILSHRPKVLEVDGEEIEPQWFGDLTLVLSRGQHIVTMR